VIQQAGLFLLPEYTGSLLAFVSEVRVLEPSDAQNRDCWAVTRGTAEEFDLEAMSGLTLVADQLVAGGAPETRERPTGLPGMEQVDDVVFADLIDLDPGGPLTAEALEQGDIDVAGIFTGQGVIAVDNEDPDLVAEDWLIDKGRYSG